MGVLNVKHNNIPEQLYMLPSVNETWNNMQQNIFYFGFLVGAAILSVVTVTYS